MLTADNSYTYENTSNLLASIEALVHAIDYAYEPNRNLMTIVDNQVGASSVSKYTCRYQGRRVEKKVESFDGSFWTIDSHQRFIYDGWNLTATFDASSSPLGLQSTYLWGLDLSGSMQAAHSTGSGLKARSTSTGFAARSTGSGLKAHSTSSGLKAGGVGGLLSETDHTSPLTTFYPLFDANGNVSEYLDDTGTIQAHYEYSPFGRVIASTGTAGVFAFRFSTKYTDSETGLLYYGFRYNDPQTGRWLSRDPIGERGGLNLYGFVGNEPVGRWDLLGLEILMNIQAGDRKQDLFIGIHTTDGETIENLGRGTPYVDTGEEDGDRNRGIAEEKFQRIWNWWFDGIPTVRAYSLSRLLPPGLDSTISLPFKGEYRGEEFTFTLRLDWESGKVSIVSFVGKCRPSFRIDNSIHVREDRFRDSDDVDHFVPGDGFER